MTFHFSSAIRRRAVIVTALSAALLAPATTTLAATPFAPTGTLVGTATCGADAVTPAPRARIAVDGMNLSTSTDSAGKFTLTNVPSGQLLQIDALADSSGAVTSIRYNVSVQAGAVTDIGNLDLVACPAPQSTDTQVDTTGPSQADYGGPAFQNVQPTGPF